MTVADMGPVQLEPGRAGSGVRLPVAGKVPLHEFDRRGRGQAGAAVTQQPSMLPAPVSPSGRSTLRPSSAKVITLS
jgi:hypothetical protein